VSDSMYKVMNRNNRIPRDRAKAFQTTPTRRADEARTLGHSDSTDLVDGQEASASAASSLRRCPGRAAAKAGRTTHPFAMDGGYVRRCSNGCIGAAASRFRRPRQRPFVETSRYPAGSSRTGGSRRLECLLQRFDIRLGEDAAFGDDARDVSMRRRQNAGFRILAPTGVRRDEPGASPHVDRALQ
jgi:hypothetical protein